MLRISDLFLYLDKLIILIEGSSSLDRHPQRDTILSYYSLIRSYFLQKMHILLIIRITLSPCASYLNQTDKHRNDYRGDNEYARDNTPILYFFMRNQSIKNAPPLYWKSFSSSISLSLLNAAKLKRNLRTTKFFSNYF